MLPLKRSWADAPTVSVFDKGPVEADVLLSFLLHPAIASIMQARMVYFFIDQDNR